ncbi:ABC transporter ATP-binding protein [Arthrospira platensis]|uniref:ABC transporter ATP-binding protein n=1 Tax=Limnospira platensis NIES-46 TaxID=1236695 RepID=A0A5M3T8U7_LIMPL|nr:ABC transporter ATP-binding protein [Arthrospira platensis]AMW28888.1 ABC transporter ATP-binding protein [Arthrospira platensis YZ]KDR56006.1 ABC transporter ATP-binding protein [Arthrospira platensis str. Paraca]MBD2669790.1 ABC transporter ATP-binding protein [Arthrospira platensis FACHB-439]MBD2710349.1 ABC transporter ATP-binding protein [Arthrospira platensis FACHB-835]MDF2212639.1 ABC transporter ATP-binding protein [Arthrospira platensis NCB002]MDT9183016.1 ABC transporter ATP-bind
MTDIAISVNQVSKCFKRYKHPVDRLKEMFWPRTSLAENFWALQDINLQVFRGQTLGIVGRNGSGKSTLLQIIAGTLTPTNGEVKVNGRVSALLELGSGFNPEFTGRQNVFFNGQLLGLTPEEIATKFDDIAAFADIGDFIDQPVKTYSSGMYIRLGFAVATSVDPDILIVDEALSVGDEAFQRKCFSRIHEIQDRGGTILFVSHSAPSIIQLCDSAVLMDKGEMLLEHTPKMIVSKYQKMIYADADAAAQVRAEIKQIKASLPPQPQVHKVISISQQNGNHSQPQSQGMIKHNPDYRDYYDPNLVPDQLIRYPSRGATIQDPHIRTLKGKRVNHLVARQTYTYNYEVEFIKSASHVRFGMLVKTVSGYELAGASFLATSQLIKYIDAGTKIMLEFQFKCLLAPDVYFLNAGVSGIVEGEFTYLDRCVDVAMFRVQPCEESCGTGVVDLLVEPQLTITSGKVNWENLDGVSVG